MSKTDDNPPIPKSIRHKKILDRAAEKPDASLAQLADGIPSATPDLVEHVLDEYGDPGSDTDTMEPTDDRPETTNATTEPLSPTVQPDQPADEESNDYPAPEELSEKQRRTLLAIKENPEATQSEIADQLDVSAPTVSNRVNDLEDFAWQTRRRYVEAVFDETDRTNESDVESQTITSATDGGSAPRLEHLEERLTDLEGRLESERSRSGDAVFDEPELVHKIVHACMDSDVITEGEELRILQALLHGSSRDGTSD